MLSYLFKNMKKADGSLVDIEVINNKITKIGNDLPIKNQTVIDGFGEMYVSNGWIDLHTHCFTKYELYGDKIDEVGYKQGVTTVVDAGSVGADTIDEFSKQIEDAKTNVYAFLNIARQGIATQDELADLNNLRLDLIEKTIQEHPNTIVGLKARMSKSVLNGNNIEPLEFALEVSNTLSLPIMVHIGTAPAKLEDVMKLLRKDDIVTHIFNPKLNGIFNSENEIHQFVLDAHQRGVQFDLGHGSESFDFERCIKANKLGLKCDSISTDIYKRNRINGPVYSLAHTMNKMLLCGYSLEEVIDKVTKSPAKLLKKDYLGNLEVGNCGDLTFFKISEKTLELCDSKGVKKVATSVLEPCAVLLHDEYIVLQ